MNDPGRLKWCQPECTTHDYTRAYTNTLAFIYGLTLRIGLLMDAGMVV